MISPLAKGDYEDLLAAGLPATLEDFDRLNTIALRLTNGPETTAANFPRVGWAGEVPFYQPTCAAISWYLTYVDRADFSTETKNACWYYALSMGRDAVCLESARTAKEIERAVDAWLSSLPVTVEEVARACRYATNGYDDATPGKTPAQAEADAAKTDAERREESLGNLEERVTAAAAATGIRPDDLMAETPSRLDAMIETAKRLSKCECGRDEARLRRDYDMTYREIRKRLEAETEL